MSRPSYTVKNSYTGTGSLDTYSFDFKITALTQLLVVVMNASGVEVERVRGDDTSYLSSVTFDAVEGAGEVVLLANLPSGYVIYLILADDEPVQSFEFKNKSSFSLSKFERALDALAGAIQRLSYISKQSLRIHDSDDESTFDNMLPSGVADNPDKILIVNATGDGWDYGPDWNDIPTAQASADDAMAAAVAAQATADSAVIAAASAQSTANTGVANAATAQAAADAAQAAADAAQSDATDALAVTNLIDPAWVATESVGAGGTITVNSNYWQNRKVQGNGAARTTSNTPFGTTFSATQDGMRILLVGKNATNTLTIPYVDTAWGCMLNGDATLGLNDSIELILDYSAQRFYEISRNF